MHHGSMSMPWTVADFLRCGVPKVAFQIPIFFEEGEDGLWHRPRSSCSAWGKTLVSTAWEFRDHLCPECWLESDGSDTALWHEFIVDSSILRQAESTLEMSPGKDLTRLQQLLEARWNLERSRLGDAVASWSESVQTRLRDNIQNLSAAVTDPDGARDELETHLLRDALTTAKLDTKNYYLPRVRPYKVQERWESWLDEGSLEVADIGEYFEDLLRLPEEAPREKTSEETFPQYVLSMRTASFTQHYAGIVRRRQEKVRDRLASPVEMAFVPVRSRMDPDLQALLWKLPHTLVGDHLVVHAPREVFERIYLDHIPSEMRTRSVDEETLEILLSLWDPRGRRRGADRPNVSLRRAREMAELLRDKATGETFPSEVEPAQ